MNCRTICLCRCVILELCLQHCLTTIMSILWTSLPPQFRRVKMGFWRLAWSAKIDNHIENTFLNFLEYLLKTIIPQIEISNKRSYSITFFLWFVFQGDVSNLKLIKWQKLGLMKLIIKWQACQMTLTIWQVLRSMDLIPCRGKSL